MTKYEIIEALRLGLTETKNKIKIVTTNEKGNIYVIFTLIKHWYQSYDFFIIVDRVIKTTGQTNCFLTDRAKNAADAFSLVEKLIEENKLELIKISTY